MEPLARLEKACAKLPHTARAMFGGHGLLAANGAMFAGVWDGGKVLLKVADAREREAMLADGGATWVQRSATRTRAMPSWVVVPERVATEPRLLAA